MTDNLLLLKVEQWLEDDQFQKVIDTLHELSEKDLNYALKSYLACALNGNTQMEDAIRVLLTIEKEGENDPLWFFRMGYAYYYLHQREKALPYFQKTLQLNPRETSVQMFIEWCTEDSPIVIPA